MVATRIEEIEAVAAKERQKDHGGTAPGKRKNTGPKNGTSDQNGRAAKKAAKQLSVSQSMVSDAKRIKRESPESLLDLADLLRSRRPFTLKRESHVPNPTDEIQCQECGNFFPQEETRIVDEVNGELMDEPWRVCFGCVEIVEHEEVQQRERLVEHLQECRLFAIALAKQYPPDMTLREFREELQGKINQYKARKDLEKKLRPPGL